MNLATGSRRAYREHHRNIASFCRHKRNWAQYNSEGRMYKEENSLSLLVFLGSKYHYHQLGEML
jgi:hypothetical protein